MYFRLIRGAIKSYTIFTRKHLCWSLFFNKVTGLRYCNFIKKRLQHWFFSVNFAKFLTIPFLQNASGRLLLTTAQSDSYENLIVLFLVLRYFDDFTFS